MPKKEKNPFIAQRIAIARARVDMKQKEAADALGMSINTYRNWEQGNNEPNSFDLVRLARLFKTSTDFLLNSPYSSLDGLGLDESEQRLISAFRGLDPSRQETVLSFVDDQSKLGSLEQSTTDNKEE